jgi:hypothetical protein
LEKPLIRNQYEGFFLTPEHRTSTYCFFLGSRENMVLYFLNGSSSEETLSLKRRKIKEELTLLPGHTKEITILKTEGIEYPAMVKSRYLVPLKLRSSQCWNENELYPGSPDAGLYINQPISTIKTHGGLRLIPGEHKFHRNLAMGWILSQDPPPYDNGRWAGIYSRSAILFKPRKGSDYNLTIRGRTPIKGQTVRIRWNETILGTWKPGNKSSTFKHTIPANDILDSQVNTLWLEHKKIESPKNYFPQSRIFQPCGAFYESITLEISK